MAVEICEPLLENALLPIGERENAAGRELLYTAVEDAYEGPEPVKSGRKRGLLSRELGDGIANDLGPGLASPRCESPQRRFRLDIESYCRHLRASVSRAV